MRVDYQYAAVIEFDDAAGLKGYLEHPVHERLASQFFEAFEQALMYDFELADDGDRPGRNLARDGAPPTSYRVPLAERRVNSRRSNVMLRPAERIRNVDGETHGRSGSTGSATPS